uniref:Uncharacterized protein n=1 Tax=Setaria italica TaxID=4555 RepID=K3Z1T7_SETIT
MGIRISSNTKMMQQGWYVMYEAAILIAAAALVTLV